MVSQHRGWGRGEMGTGVTAPRGVGMPGRRVNFVSGNRQIQRLFMAGLFSGRTISRL